MPFTAIICLVAGCSTATLIFIWFRFVKHSLQEKQKRILLAKEQMELHSLGLETVRGMEEEHTARHILSSSLEIYVSLQEDYHQALRHPLYRIPGFFMGFL